MNGFNPGDLQIKHILISTILIWLGFTLYFISQIYHILYNLTQAFFQKPLIKTEENVDIDDENSLFL